ncbi:MAG: DUF721 domain-containing protein [Bdellovibrionota bacterium]
MSYKKRETEFLQSQELRQGLIENKDRVSLYRLKRKAENPQRFLSAFFYKRGLSQKFAEYQFVSNWKDIVGEGIANNATPMLLKNRVLYIKVSSASWMQELSFQKLNILQKLNNYFASNNKVKDLKFVLE